MKQKTEFQPQDIFINFRDLLLYVLLRWRSILVVVIITTLLAGGYKYLKDWRAYQAADAGSSSDAADTEIELDAEARARVTAVLAYRDAYEAVCDYNAEALLMSIQADAVPTVNMSYLIAGERCYAAAALYQKHLAAEDLYADLSGQLTDAVDGLPAYLAELVTTSLEQMPEAAEQSADYLLLNIRVVAPTEELCQRVAQVVRERMTGLAATVRKAAGDFTVSLAYDQYAVLRINGIRDQQQASLKSQNTLKTSLEEAEAELSADELAYVRQQEQEELGEEPVKATPPSISKKWLVLGFLGGGVLMVLWYALRYIFGGRIQSEMDVTVRHGVTVFGSLADGKKRFFIDRWLLSLLSDKPMCADLLQQQVVLAAKAADSRAVYLVTTDGTAAPADLEEALQAASITLQTGDSPLVSAEAMRAMAAADSLLLVKRAGVSSHKQMGRELELAQQFGQTVLGTILVK